MKEIVFLDVSSSFRFRSTDFEKLISDLKVAFAEGKLHQLLLFGGSTIDVSSFLPETLDALTPSLSENDPDFPFALRAALGSSCTYRPNLDKIDWHSSEITFHIQIWTDRHFTP